MEKKPKKVIVSPKIDPEAAGFYDRMFKSRNAGVTFAIESLPHIYRITLSEMRGKFSEGELGMVLDVLKGNAFQGPFGASSGQHVGMEIEDSFRLYPGIYEEKWGISDPSGFVSRLDGLSRWQLVCLGIWAGGFWASESDLTEWCKPLL